MNAFKLNNIIFTLGLTLLLFFTNSIGRYLGFERIITVSNSIFVILSLILILRNNQILGFNENRPIMLLFSVLFLIFFQVWVLGNIDSAIGILKDWSSPLLIMIYLENSYYKKRKIIIIVLMTFFFIECFVGFYERVTLNHLFIDQNEIGDGQVVDNVREFRATSLLGHPLNNAHLIHTMLGAILASELKSSIKLFSYITAVLAVVSFNARFASLVAMISYPLVLISLYDSTTNRKFRVIFLVSLLLFIAILFIMFETDLGGRLIHGEELMDDSALSRIEALKVLNEIITDGTLYFGTGVITEEFITENGFLNLIIKYGLILSILMIIAQFNLVLSRLNHLSRSKKVIFVCFFFVVGFSNNAFSSAAPISMFCTWICIVDSWKRPKLL